MRLKYALFLVFVFLLHVFVTMYWSLWGYAFCFLYAAILIFLPIEFGTVLAMLLAFGLGLLTDMFYGTPGVHTAGLLLVAYLRPRVLRMLQPSAGYEANRVPHFRSMGWSWMLLYSFPLLVLHCTVSLALEYGSLLYIGHAVLKGVLSAVFTLAVMLFLQAMFAKTILRS